jgi:hypothetical protein
MSSSEKKQRESDPHNLASHFLSFSLSSSSSLLSISDNITTNPTYKQIFDQFISLFIYSMQFSDKSPFLFTIKIKK